MSLSKKVVLTVSGYKISLSDSLQFYQNDQLKLIFEINKYGIDVASSFTHKTLMPLQPLTATLFIETPLGVDSIESANIEDNAVTFFISSKYTQYVGVSNMQIQLADSDGCQISLPPFSFEVKKIIYDGSVISTPEAHPYIYYGRVSASEAGVPPIIQYDALTADMIKNAAAMTVIEPQVLGKTSCGLEKDTATGDYLLVAVPSSSNYVVTKDNGIGGKVVFNEDDAAGANGQYLLDIDGVEYKLYGEVLLSPVQIFIYVDER